MKVMIIDDVESNLDVMKITMELEDHNVLPLGSARDLIPQVLSYMPDIILLDIELGEFDGREVCQELKNLPLTKSIPIIIISASTEVKIQSSMDYGADQIIRKPFDVSYLVKEVDRLVFG